MLFTEGMGLPVVLEFGCQKFHLLCDVSTFLVILAVVVDIHEESPVIKVIDGILEEGIGCSVTPKVMMEPGREWLHWFVSGIVWRCI